MKKLDISTYEIKDRRIDKPLKMVFLSDLHNTNIVKEIVKIVDKENPNCIIMGGDMINESINEIDNYVNLLKELDKYKIYYVFGNHEERLEPDIETINYDLEDYKDFAEQIYNREMF